MPPPTLTQVGPGGGVRRPPDAALTTGSRCLSRAALDSHIDGGHDELEGGPAAVARGDPDPASKGVLDDETAQVEAESQAALRAVAACRARLFEEPVEAR